MEENFYEKSYLSVPGHSYARTVSLRYIKKKTTKINKYYIININNIKTKKKKLNNLQLSSFSSPY